MNLLIDLEITKPLLFNPLEAHPVEILRAI
jgi:hypothetical protein